MRHAVWLVLVGCRFAFDALPAATLDAAGGDGGDASLAPDARPIDLIPGLRAWYPLDESTFTAGTVDATGAAQPIAQCTGAECPAPVAGRVNGAALLDGNVDCFRVPYHAKLGTPNGFTIAAFVMPTATTGNNSIVAKPHDDSLTANTWQLEFADSPMLQLKARSAVTADELVISPAALPMTSWSHVAGSWDGTTLRIYVNGVDVNSGALTMLLVDTNDVFIGCDDNGAGNVSHFTGRIDDVRIYGGALSGNEIMLLANQ